MRNISFTPNVWKDYTSWFNDKKTIKRINKLIEQAARTPFEGLGKPEALRNELSGYWSRRIKEKDRLVYKATEEQLIIISCKLHYSDK